MENLKKPYPREQRGLAIASKGDQVRKIGTSTYSVQSQSGDDTYIVKKAATTWKCECPDFVYRKLKCKHILAVKFSLKMKKEIPQDSKPDYPRVKEKKCPRCNSANIVKHGFKYNQRKKVQRYRCKDCGRRLILNKGFKRMRNGPKIVTLSLDLYFKGVSLRKIVDHIRQFHGIEVTHIAVYKWIHKYVQLIRRHVDKLAPNVSEIWHSDEMMLKLKGDWKWLWNLIDHNTRFLLASHVTEKREIKDARRLFARAKNSAKKRPTFVVTDGLLSYKDAFKKEFFTQKTPKTEHISLASIHGFVNNNIVERLHGTIRERNKVMRGLGNNGSAPDILEGYKIYYNFIRPHMGLNGKTPAEAANLPLQLGDNKWLSLIRMSMDGNGNQSLGEANGSQL